MESVRRLPGNQWRPALFSPCPETSKEGSSFVFPVLAKGVNETTVSQAKFHPNCANHFFKGDRFFQPRVSFQVWRTYNGFIVAVISKAHAGSVAALVSAPAGNMLYSGGDDGWIRIWEAPGRQGVRRVGGGGVWGGSEG